MLKSWFCEDISVEYEFRSETFKGVSIDLKLNNLDLSGNTTEFKKHCRRAHADIDIYCLYICDVICQNLSF